MRCEFSRAESRRQRFGALQGSNADLGDHPNCVARRESQPGLASADQLQINPSSELRVEQRSMLGTAGEIDPEPPAKLVQGIPRSRNPGFCNLDCVDGASCRNERPRKAKQL